MTRYRVLKPWRFSRHGHDAEDAPAGAVLSLADDLGAEGIATGHLAQEPDDPAPVRRQRKAKP